MAFFICESLLTIRYSQLPLDRIIDWFTVSDEAQRLVKLVRKPISNIEIKILTFDVRLAGGTVGEIARPNHALYYCVLQRQKQ